MVFAQPATWSRELPGFSFRPESSPAMGNHFGLTAPCISPEQVSAAWRRCFLPESKPAADGSEQLERVRGNPSSVGPGRIGSSDAWPSTITLKIRDTLKARINQIVADATLPHQREQWVKELRGGVRVNPQR